MGGEAKCQLRIEFDETEETEFQGVLANRREGDADITAAVLLTGWLYDLAVKSVTETKDQMLKDKFVVTMGRQDGSSAVGVSKPEDFADFPWGTSDGEGGYHVPIRDILALRLQKAAKLSASKLKAQAQIANFSTIQEFVNHHIQMRLNNEVATLQTTELNTEMGEALKALKPAAKDK